MPDLSPQRLDHVLRARSVERNHIDDDVGTEIRDFRAELPGFFFCPAIEQYVLDMAPGVVGTIGFRGAAADIHDLIPKLDESGHQVAPDVTTPTDHDDARHGLFLCCSTKGPSLPAIRCGHDVDRPALPRARSVHL